MTNTNTSDKYWKWAIIALVIYTLIDLFGKFAPDITTEPTPKQQALAGKLDTHAIRSAIERQYRDSLQAQISRDNARYADWKRNYKPVAQKAAVSVKRYQEKPTPANCDTAVTDLLVQVKDLTTGLAQCDSISSRKDSLNASLNMTVQRQEGVISEVGKIGQDALAENAVLQKKLKRRNRLIAIGAGAIALFVGGVVANK